MDLKQLEYVLAITECKSMSKAAERLYLTQSALSQQVSKLEKECGCPLFIRDRNGITPTPAGRVMIDGARKMLKTRDDMLCSLSGFRKEQEKRIVVGAASGRSTALFGRIYHDFMEKYPDYEIRLQESSSYEAERALLKDRVDLALTVLLPEELQGPFSLSHECLRKEKLLLIVPKDHPLVPAGYSASGVSDCPPIDLSLFRKEHFVLPSLRTKLRSHIDSVFKKSGFVPQIAYEVLGTSHICRSLQGGMLCTVIPSGFLEPSDYIAWFSVEDELSMEYAVCWNPVHALTDAEKWFISLCRENTSEIR